MEFVNSRGRDIARPLQRSLSPLIFLMRIFGLIAGDAFESASENSVQPTGSQSLAIAEVEETSGNDRRHQSGFFLGKLYCILVGLGLLVLSGISLSYTVRASNFATISRLLCIVLFFLLCGLQVMVCALTISRKPGGSRFVKFFKAMENALQSSKLDPPKPRYAKIGLIFCLAVVVLNALLLNCLLFLPFTRELFTDFLLGDKTVATKQEWIVIMYCLYSVHMSATWVLPTIFYIVTCLNLADLFSSLKERASHTIKDNHGEIDVSFLRTNHLKLCHAVEALDEVLSPLGLVSYGCNIPLVCLFLNATVSMVNKKLDVFVIMTMVFWNMMNVATTALCSLAGAHLNTKAHSLTEVIYDVDLKKVDPLQRAELTLFLTKLNQETISPTIGGIVPVTKGMILTVFGTIVGYLTILIQFK